MINISLFSANLALRRKKLLLIWAKEFIKMIPYGSTFQSVRLRYQTWVGWIYRGGRLEMEQIVYVSELVGFAKLSQLSIGQAGAQAYREVVWF
jgi:hypothetical protein